jgi:hypothetical protein
MAVVKRPLLPIVGNGRSIQGGNQVAGGGCQRRACWYSIMLLNSAAQPSPRDETLHR